MINRELHQLVVHLDEKFDRRIDALDQKISKQFIWLVGIQITVLLAIIAALLGK